MIAQRFRALGWVGGIACAATGLYLISVQVAAERAKLEDVDRRITAAQRDMRALQTEFGTRASLRQLERFNSETLTLVAPRAGQYLHGNVQLASLTLDKVAPGRGRATPSATVEAASTVQTPSVIPAIVERGREASPRVEHAAFAPTAPRRSEPHLERAAYVPPARGERLAMVEHGVIDRETLGDLARTAAQERKQRP